MIQLEMSDTTVKRTRKPRAPKVDSEPEAVVETPEVEVEHREEETEKSTDPHQNYTNDLATLHKNCLNLAAAAKTMAAQAKVLMTEFRRLPKTRTARARANGDAPKNTAFSKQVLMNDNLCEFFGLPAGSRMARSEISAKLNKYFDEHGLREPENRRIIKPDKRLLDCFGAFDLKLVRTVEGKPLNPIMGSDPNRTGLCMYNLQSYISKGVLPEPQATA